MYVFEKVETGAYDNKLDFKADRKAYHLEDGRLREQFKQDLEMEHGLDDHPKRDRLFELAWEHGHSSGYREVAIYYDEFAELLKD